MPVARWSAWSSLHLRMDESLWVRIKERADKCDIILRLCYRPPPDQEDQAGEALYKQPHIQKPWSSWGTSTIPILVGGMAQQGISNPEGSWKVLMRTSFSK